jgi:hypothetical protein
MPASWSCTRATPTPTSESRREQVRQTAASDREGIDERTNGCDDPTTTFGPGASMSGRYKPGSQPEDGGDLRHNLSLLLRDLSLLLVMLGSLLLLVGLGGLFLRLGSMPIILTVLGLLFFVLRAWRAARPEHGYPLESYDPNKDYGGIRGSSFLD